MAERFPHSIFDEKAGPFVSLYQPTQKAGPEKQQNVIIFRKLVKEAAQVLEHQFPEVDREKLLEPVYALEQDRAFWRSVDEGLAVFAAENRCVVYRLSRPVRETVVTEHRPYISPLIRVFQSADYYQLLGLNMHTFSLFEGNRYGFREVAIPAEVERTKEEVLGERSTESHIDKGSVSGSGGSRGAYFGKGDKQDEIDKDTEKFFRFVDRYVTEQHSKKTQLPLILAAVKEHHGHFRKISSNPYLMEAGVKCAFDALDAQEMTTRVWEIIEPLYLEKTKTLVGTFERARANGGGSAHLEEIAIAAVENRLVHLMIEDDRVVPGTVDAATGEVLGSSGEADGRKDILGDLAELAFKRSVPLVVLPKERMPVDTGAAAVFR
ncbi:hypothetical protein [Alkalicoccus chagannorensis]